MEDRQDIVTPSEEEMQQAFKEYDRDGNGFVEREEMKKYIRKQLGCPEIEENENEN